jgi:hypothetical protein
MIVDQVILAGDRARFRSTSGRDPFNLNAAGANTVPIGPMPDGAALSVSGVAVMMKARDIESLLERPNNRNEPLIQVSVVKEMYRGLFKDPYAHRVYTIEGFEDFRRGKATNLQAMEVEGKATLVSLGNQAAQWTSGLYQLPEPVTFSAVAWDIAASQHTNPNAFHYSIQVQLWDAGTNTTDQPSNVISTSRDNRLNDLNDPRFIEETQSGAAMRLLFSAQVKYEAAFHEQHAALAQNISLGTPLLRSVHLLEPITPAYALMSLMELQVRAREFIVYRGDPSAPPDTVTAVIDLPCYLGRGEWIQIQYLPGIFSRAEAWLIATSHTRPPVSES